MNKIFLRLTMLFFTLFLTQAVWAEIKIGVNLHRDVAETLERWKELANYLSKELAQPVKIVPLSAAKSLEIVAAGGVDFMLDNPVNSAILIEKQGKMPLATLNAKEGTQFAGVIVAKKGSGITKSVDLKGKKVMSLAHKRAAGGYMFQTYHLYKQGIDPDKDFASFKEGKSQDDLVLAVDKGFIDAAFVRSGILESMDKKGEIKINDFVVVDSRTDPELPFLHTTELYPEWCLVTAANTDPQLAETLKAAVLKIKPDSKAAQTAEINGFVEPLSYQMMVEMMKALKIPPFEQ